MGIGIGERDWVEVGVGGWGFHFGHFPPKREALGVQLHAQILWGENRIVRMECEPTSRARQQTRTSKLCNDIVTYYLTSHVSA